VAMHGVWADHKAFSNLRVVETVRDQLEYVRPGHRDHIGRAQMVHVGLGGVPLQVALDRRHRQLPLPVSLMRPRLPLALSSGRRALEGAWENHTDSMRFYA
jgi:hypothetical protein